ncbi:MAG: ABC transporter permease [Candidatus Fermentithermobacillus carboniphilus]|uniref:ABC transporter permease n=1 Tax=Candidatus Fermentithermobacillus carboniphilus TaxID=3085328 RepID=A0AAT9LEG2_9FIRM|nr:MAG: ABC transporter permease [Candidatus Fermentithermobacillus carboniphilus]
MRVLMEKDLKQVWRSFRLPAYYLVLLFLAVSDPLTAKYMGKILERFAQGITIILPTTSPSQAMAQFLGDLVELGLVVVIAITMGSVAGERSSGVLGFLLTKPVTRKRYILSKYSILVAGVVAGVVLSSALAQSYIRTLIGPAPVAGAWLATASVAVYTVYILSATFSASMMTESSLAAGGTGLLVLFATGVTGTLLQSSWLGPYLPTALVRNISSYLEQSSGALSSTQVASFIRPAISSVLLSLLFLSLGYLRFRKVELP